MTLRELFIPNKFGTMPIINIYAVGSIIYNPQGYAELFAKDEHYIIDLDTRYTLRSINDNKIKVLHEAIELYNAECTYILPMTPENYLIHNAIKPIKNVKCFHRGILRDEALLQSMLDTLHDDGSGWAEIHGELVPVTFYIEDILYRLDLQGKLT